MKFFDININVMICMIKMYLYVYKLGYELKIMCQFYINNNPLARKQSAFMSTLMILNLLNLIRNQYFLFYIKVNFLISFLLILKLLHKIQKYCYL